MSAQSVQSQTLNGLLYQGRKIQGNEAFHKTLTRGDFFRIGDEHGNLVTLTFRDGSGNQQEIVSRLQPVRLGASQLNIGRLQDNDVVLNHPQVSAHHAYLVQEGDTYRLTDLDSTNHSYVNGLRVSSQLLQARDEIRIGPFRFIYAAKLRLPRDFTEEQIEERIDEVLDDVEMKHRRQLLVSQLPGGTTQARLYCPRITGKARCLFSG